MLFGEQLRLRYLAQINLKSNQNHFTMYFLSAADLHVQKLCDQEYCDSETVISFVVLLQGIIPCT
jgi:hypothetical protein